MKKHPLVFSILITMLMLVFPVVSGAIISVLQLSTLQGRLVQTAAFVIAGLVGLIIAKRAFGALGDVGMRRVRPLDGSRYLWFLPIVLVEACTLLLGFSKESDIAAVAVMLAITVAVGFAEELYFRGIIPRILRSNGRVFSILLSSFLFSVGHFFNLLAGASVGMTILQVVFAFIFGVVAVEIRMLSGSIGIVVVWHFLHNFLSLITVSNQGVFGVLLGIFQGTVLVLYALYLRKKLFNDVGAKEAK